MRNLRAASFAEFSPEARLRPWLLIDLISNRRDDTEACRAVRGDRRCIGFRWSNPRGSADSERFRLRDRYADLAADRILDGHRDRKLATPADNPSPNGSVNICVQRSNGIPRPMSLRRAAPSSNSNANHAHRSTDLCDLAGFRVNFHVIFPRFLSLYRVVTASSRFLYYFFQIALQRSSGQWFADSDNADSICRINVRIELESQDFDDLLVGGRTRNSQQFFPLRVNRRLVLVPEIFAANCSCYRGEIYVGSCVRGSVRVRFVASDRIIFCKNVFCKILWLFD